MACFMMMAESPGLVVPPSHEIDHDFFDSSFQLRMEHWKARVSHICSKFKMQASYLGPFNLVTDGSKIHDSEDEGCASRRQS
jgi:hypothetical protein